jgi:DNA-binding transcriptional ArsR family regulator
MAQPVREIGEGTREIAQLERQERQPEMLDSPQNGHEKPATKTDVYRVFHALGDPTRRMILEELTSGPVSVSRLATPLDMSLAAVVQHLQVLEESGLVRTEKLGRVRTCSINPTGLAIAQDWIAVRRSTWEKRLDRLGDVLAELS